MGVAISPENQGIAEQDVPGNVPGGTNPTGGRPPALSGQTSLEWIKVKVRDEPQLVFTSLAHQHGQNHRLCADIDVIVAEIEGSVV
jgi:hypothetical protein